MVKISQLPSDLPQTGDYVPGLQSATTSTKRFSFANLITLIFNNIPLNKIQPNYISNPYKFYGYRSAAYTTYTNGSPVALDAKAFDTNNNLDIVTNKGRWTVPVAGFYWLNAAFTASINANSNTGYCCVLMKNGSDLLQGERNVNMYAGAYQTTCVATGLVQLNAGDYIEFRGDGAGGNMTLVNGITTNYMQGFLVSAT